MGSNTKTGGRGIALIFLALSLMAAVLAVVVIFLVFQRLGQDLSSAQTGQKTTKVVVARETLHQGHPIDRQDVLIAEIEPDYVPQSVFTSIDDVLGRVPQERILQGDVLRTQRLAEPDAGIGLNAIIPTGMRALQLSITNGSAVSGFVNPGNFVDVLVTYRERKGKPLQTVTMLQAVKVIAVDNRLGQGDDLSTKVRPSVTLQVTPEEAQRIIQADIDGTVTLTLRNDIDVTQQTTHGTRTNELIGKKEEKKTSMDDLRKIRKERGLPPPTAKPKGHEILVIEGGRVRRVQYDAEGNKKGRGR